MAKVFCVDPIEQEESTPVVLDGAFPVHRLMHIDIIPIGLVFEYNSEFWLKTGTRKARQIGSDFHKSFDGNDRIFVDQNTFQEIYDTVLREHMDQIQRDLAEITQGYIGES